MTAVVGILNKRGVAIAADSAVTRRGNKANGLYSVEKVTKNGDKMVRLSDVDPITVMLTGNAEFLSVPWEVIARRYRQQRGKIHHSTVEELARDFFDYIADTSVFWCGEVCDRFLKSLAKKVFDKAGHELSQSDDNERKKDGSLIRPATFRKKFISNLRNVAREYSKQGHCPQFEGYTIEEFRKSSSDILDSFFNEKTVDPHLPLFRYHYPKDVLDAVRPFFEEALLTVLGSRTDYDDSATLVFTGYGKDQKYPSLVSAEVGEGYDCRVNYTIDPKNIICISDKKPVAICPFAQADVIKSLIGGIYEDWLEKTASLKYITNPYFSDVFDIDPLSKRTDFEFMKLLEYCNLDCEDLHKKFKKELLRMVDANWREWQKALERYDLEEMATLADSLISLTGFHRILTFLEEGVGGLVDLAVISRNEGFTWLRRKNWYNEHAGGSNGGFGI